MTDKLNLFGTTEINKVAITKNTYNDVEWKDTFKLFFSVYQTTVNERGTWFVDRICVQNRGMPCQKVTKILLSHF